MEEWWLKLALRRAGRVVLFEDHPQLVHTIFPRSLKT